MKLLIKTIAIVFILINSFLSKGANISPFLDITHQKKENKFHNRLCKALHNNNIEYIKELLKKGADPNGKIQNKNDKIYFLVYAIEHNYFQITELLLKYGAKTNIWTYNHSNILNIFTYRNKDITTFSSYINLMLK